MNCLQESALSRSRREPGYTAVVVLDAYCRYSRAIYTYEDSTLEWTWAPRPTK